jgi:hypothetical protein
VIDQDSEGGSIQNLPSASTQSQTKAQAEARDRLQQSGGGSDTSSEQSEHTDGSETSDAAGSEGSDGSSSSSSSSSSSNSSETDGDADCRGRGGQGQSRSRGQEEDGRLSHHQAMTTSDHASATNCSSGNHRSHPTFVGSDVSYPHSKHANDDSAPSQVSPVINDRKSPSPNPSPSPSNSVSPSPKTNDPDHEVVRETQWLHRQREEQERSLAMQKPAYEPIQADMSTCS